MQYKEWDLLELIHSPLNQDLLPTRVAPTLLYSRPQFDQDFRLDGGILYHQEYIYVLEGQPKLEVLRLGHNILVSGHFAHAKTETLLDHNFWCSKLHSDISS